MLDQSSELLLPASHGEETSATSATGGDDYGAC